MRKRILQSTTDYPHSDTTCSLHPPLWTKVLIHYQTQSDDPISCCRNSYAMRDYIGPLHWFPVATGRIGGLNLTVGRGLRVLS